jgi:superfamily II DNA/RNA helicase
MLSAAGQQRLSILKWAESATWLVAVKEDLMNFEQFLFDPRIQAGIQAAGYVTPTPIQQQAIPVALAATCSVWHRPAPAKPPLFCCPSCSS